MNLSFYRIYKSRLVYFCILTVYSVIYDTIRAELRKNNKTGVILLRIIRETVMIRIEYEEYKRINTKYQNISINILINNIPKNQTLSPARKVVRKRGKVKFTARTNQPMIATGDSIRGQLHDETFFGAIKYVLVINTH